MSLLKCHRCLSTVEKRSTFTSSIQGLSRKRERVPLCQAFKDGLDNRRGCYSPSLITYKLSASRSTYFHKDSRMVSSTEGGCFCPAQKRNSFANEFLFLKHSRMVSSTEGGCFCPAQKRNSFANEFLFIKHSRMVSSTGGVVIAPLSLLTN